MSKSIYKLQIDAIDTILQILHNKKQDEGLDGTEKRHVAVAYTDLEHVKAYIQMYLVEESES